MSSSYFILLMDCPFIIWHFLLIPTKKATYKRRFVPSYSMAGLSIVFLILALVLFSQSFSIHLRYVPIRHYTCRTGIPLFLAFTKTPS